MPAPSPSASTTWVCPTLRAGTVRSLDATTSILSFTNSKMSVTGCGAIGFVSIVLAARPVAVPMTFAPPLCRISCSISRENASPSTSVNYFTIMSCFSSSWYPCASSLTLFSFIGSIA